MKLRLRLASAFTATALIITALIIGFSAHAADYPVRPITMVVPYAPAGATDIVARILAKEMSAGLGQSVVVVNRAGAGSILGMQSVARAEPDGYTILMASVPLVINPSLYREVPYAQSDLTPISLISNTPSILVINKDVAARNLTELLALMKANPGKLNYASFGIGSGAHLAAMQFEHLTGVKLVHVPYRGGGPAATAVMGGEVQLTFSGIPNVLGGIQGGQLRTIAIATEQRIATLPEVPTFRELGVNYTQGTWFGLLAPAGTPEPIIRRLYEVSRQVLQRPEVRTSILTQGAEVVASTPEQFGRVIAEDTKFWGELLVNMPKVSQ